VSCMCGDILGPMTVALLMKNTWDAAKRNEGLLARPLPLV
jgi:hypothetical protein